MKFLLMFAALFLFNATANAKCLGTQESSTCIDSRGNSYTISRTSDIIIIQPKNIKNFDSPKEIDARLAKELIRKGRLASGNLFNKTYNSKASSSSYQRPN